MNDLVVGQVLSLAIKIPYYGEFEDKHPYLILDIDEENRKVLNEAKHKRVSFVLCKQCFSPGGRTSQTPPPMAQSIYRQVVCVSRFSYLSR